MNLILNESSKEFTPSSTSTFKQLELYDIQFCCSTR